MINRELLGKKFYSKKYNVVLKVVATENLYVVSLSLTVKFNFSGEKHFVGTTLHPFDYNRKNIDENFYRYYIDCKEMNESFDLQPLEKQLEFSF